MEHIYDIVIIGGGPAGYTAALYGAREGLDVLLIEKMSAGGQMSLTGEVDNYPGFDEGIDGFTLGMKMQQGAERFGTRTEYATVLSLDLLSKIKRINTDAGEFLSRTVIVATGAEPRKLGIEGEDALIGRGLHYCAHCDGRFYKGKTVAVIGGGNSAVADALYLSHLASKVILVHRRDTLRASKVYEEPLKAAQNVEFLWNSVTEDFVVDGKVKGIKVKNVLDGTVGNIECDGVFVSIGREPTSELVRTQIDVDKQGYIIADENTKTSAEGVFAAGDVRTKALRQIVTAASDGAVAAHFAGEYISLNK